jgi:hypothetical protein
MHSYSDLWVKESGGEPIAGTLKKESQRLIQHIQRWRPAFEIVSHGASAQKYRYLRRFTRTPLIGTR